MNDLLLGLHHSDSLVACGAGGDRTAADLLRDAATVAGRLPAASPGSHLLLVFKSDRYAFTVAMLAAWAAGHAVALPPNQRGETVTGLLGRTDVVGLLHDTEAGGHLRIADLLREGPDAEALPNVRLPEGTLATVFTSGSSGEIVPWTKTASQLLGEVAVLVQTFRPQPGERTIATVPPTHLYGLLFGVLLPLASGGAFLRETPLHPEAVGARVRALAAEMLVSVPVHLRAATAIPAGMLTSVRRLFCSTAPLPMQTAEAFTQQHALDITEIFGSTETGGIAWRVRSEGESWTPLVGVRVSITDDHRLSVDSPFASATGRSSQLTADLAEPGPNATFFHRGRVDGVVKIGGLRVSLPAMEESLLRQQGVEDAALVAVPAPGRGVRILAAVVASEDTEARLRKALSARFEPSTLPKRWLFVPRLPRESNGKLQRQRVLALFGLGPSGAPLAVDLHMLTTTRRLEGHEEIVAATVHVPEDYVWFQGHFETYPVMAGVVQLHELLLPIIGSHRPELGPLCELQSVKFLARISPGDDLSVTLRFAAQAGQCHFTITNRDRTCSAGQLRFAPPSS